MEANGFKLYKIALRSIILNFCNKKPFRLSIKKESYQSVCLRPCFVVLNKPNRVLSLACLVYLFARGILRLDLSATLKVSQLDGMIAYRC